MPVAPVTVSNGYNFSDDASCGFTSGTDLQNAGDPGLGPLAANGGPTLTRSPLPGSPLIDAIPARPVRQTGRMASLRISGVSRVRMARAATSAPSR
jgi:hypothetical protein